MICQGHVKGYVSQSNEKRFFIISEHICGAGKYTAMEKKDCQHILGQVLYDQAGLMAHSTRLWLETKKRYWVRIPAESDVCNRGWAYKVVQAVQRHTVCSTVYGTVHYKEPLKSFVKSSSQSRLRSFFRRDIAIMVQKAM